MPAKASQLIIDAAVCQLPLVSGLLLVYNRVNVEKVYSAVFGDSQ